MTRPPRNIRIPGTSKPVNVEPAAIPAPKQPQASNTPFLLPARFLYIENILRHANPSDLSDYRMGHASYDPMAGISYEMTVRTRPVQMSIFAANLLVGNTFTIEGIESPYSSFTWRLHSAELDTVEQHTVNGSTTAIVTALRMVFVT